MPFYIALTMVMEKLHEYYEQTAASDAHLMAMSQLRLIISNSVEETVIEVDKFSWDKLLNDKEDEDEEFLD